jgi:hypothetical protein
LLLLLMLLFTANENLVAAGKCAQASSPRHDNCLSVEGLQVHRAAAQHQQQALEEDGHWQRLSSQLSQIQSSLASVSGAVQSLQQQDAAATAQLQWLLWWPRRRRT